MERAQDFVFVAPATDLNFSNAMVHVIKSESPPGFVPCALIVFLA